MVKHYKFSFDVYGLILFIVIMIPNFIWFAIPAPNDILRNESITNVIDTIASISQTVMVAVLCFIKRTDVAKLRIINLLKTGVLFFCLVYFVTWIFYYCGIINPIIIISLCASPCLAFAAYAFNRKNYIALIPLFVFFVCHLIYGIVNFII